jgi:hypothetical protein
MCTSVLLVPVSFFFIDQKGGRGWLGSRSPRGNFEFALANWSGDMMPELWAIKKYGTAGMTEVHIQQLFHNGPGVWINLLDLTALVTFSP